MHSKSLYMKKGLDQTVCTFYAFWAAVTHNPLPCITEDESVTKSLSTFSVVEKKCIHLVHSRNMLNGTQTHTWTSEGNNISQTTHAKSRVQITSLHCSKFSEWNLSRTSCWIQLSIDIFRSILASHSYYSAETIFVL